MTEEPIAAGPNDVTVRAAIDTGIATPYGFAAAIAEVPTWEELRRFADAIRADEREACAAFAGRLAEMMELGAGETEPGGRLRQVEDTILRGNHYPFDERAN